MPRSRWSFPLLALPVLSLAAACSSTSEAADPQLVAYISAIKAIDVHAHPLSYTVPGAPGDSDSDALPLDGLPPFALPWGLRPENPAYRDAQRALYGVDGSDTGAARVKRVTEARDKAMTHRGTGFPAAALAQAGIDVMLANRIAMGPGLSPLHFRWVSFVDALMLPLDVSGEAARTPDTQVLYPLEARLLRRYLADLGLSALPPSLDGYVTSVVNATLERQKAGGAVGVKFEAAYLRPLDFVPADSHVAHIVYAHFAAGGVPDHLDYELLENYLFRAITLEAGRLGLTVQIHVIDGFGGYYDASGSHPELLESVFDDPALRGTTFQIVHGGWPHVDETLAMLAKPNVYTDISMMDQIAEPAALVRALRMWLAAWPEKVMFGTDAFDGGAAQGWEQVAWVAVRNARRALAVALTGMVRDGEITDDRARALARMVMRENALRAYHLDLK